MKKTIIYNLIVMACVGGTTQAVAQNWAIKPHVNIGVGSAMNVKSDIPGMSKSSTSINFGIDGGYTFWRKSGNRLEVNLGLSYTSANLKLGVPSMSYNYDAPPQADEDGNAYVRYYELSGMEQKFNVGYLNIPLYLTYGYQFSRRIAVHADLGVKLGFKCTSKITSVIGKAVSYGVFPEYDNLVIKKSYLDGFGKTDLCASKRKEPETNGFYAGLMAGVALDIFIADPVWLNIGVRYDCGFTNVYKNNYKNTYNMENAPVTYTVSSGQEVKSLTGYLTSSKLSPISIMLGLTISL